MKFCSVFIINLLLFSCSSGKTDFAVEERAIRNLLLQERKAHFDKDTKLFTSEFADSMLSISKGKVIMATKNENEKRIEKYFSSVNFIKWDDVAEPLIRFSSDGLMAYAIVQKQVVLSYPDSMGKSFVDTTNYAWISIYRKEKGQWKIETNISTNK
ncbi:MAG: hypothetical protein V9F01_01795 [Chitinophagaceae bacterium]